MGKRIDFGSHPMDQDPIARMNYITDSGPLDLRIWNAATGEFEKYERDASGKLGPVRFSTKHAG